MKNSKPVFGSVLSIIAALGFLFLPGCEGRKEGNPQAVVQPEKWPQLKSAIAPDPEIEERVRALVAKMSLDEKIGQMVMPDIRSVTPEEIKAYHLGAVLNGGESAPNYDNSASPAEWAALADTFWEASMDDSDGRAPIPIVWGTDAVHGHNNLTGATLFPHNIGLGAANDAGLTRLIGEITAREVAVTGLDWTFAPTVAVARNMRWGRAYESYAETPEIVKNLGAALVEGLQGNFGADNIIATAKHFIGDGGTHNGTDQGDTIVSEDELLALHAPGYFGTIEAGVQSIMISYSGWNGKKMHAQKELITDVLKNRMGFDGLVLSDWDAIAQVKGCNSWDCPQAVNAGIDMFMVPFRLYWKNFIATTKAYVEDGVIPESRIDDAVTRILRVKMRAGMFDKPKPSQRPFANRLDQFGSPEHRAVAREAVRKSLVLLKNKNNILPLDRNARILVTGKGAHNFPNQTGGWSIDWQATKVSHEDFKGATSIWEGIKQATPNAVYSPDGSLLDVGSEVGAEADKFDVAVVVLSEDPYAESRGDISGFILAHAFHYPEAYRMLKRVADAGLPVVTVMLSGRPLYVNTELNLSDAFVAAWLPGSEGGGVADVLLRDEQGRIAYDFTGKLPVSWPRSHCQEPINVGDAEYVPLFPVGYGLRYGSIDMLGDDLPEGFDDVRCY